MAVLDKRYIPPEDQSTPEPSPWDDVIAMHSDAPASSPADFQPQDLGEQVQLQQGVEAQTAQAKAADENAHPIATGLRKFGDKYVAPAVEAAQKYVGRPISSAALGMAGFDPESPLPGGQTLANTPESLLAHEFYSPLSGQRSEARPSANPQSLGQAMVGGVQLTPDQHAEAWHGLNRLTRGHPEEALAGARALGQGTFMGMFPVASGVSAATTGTELALATRGITAATHPMLVNLAKVAASGAAASAEGGAYGLVQGLADRSTNPVETAKGGALFGSVLGVGGQTLVGVLTRKMAQQVQREVATLPTFLEDAPKDFSPTGATIGRDENGKLFAKVYRIGSNDVKAYRMPLETEAQAAAFSKFRKRAGFNVHPVAETDVAGTSPLWRKHVLEGSGDFARPSAVSVTRDGTVKIEPVPETPSTVGDLQKGDPVSVITAEGKTVPGRLKRVTDDKTIVNVNGRDVSVEHHQVIPAEEPTQRAVSVTPATQPIPTKPGNFQRSVGSDVDLTPTRVDMDMMPRTREIQAQEPKTQPMNKADEAYIKDKPLIGGGAGPTIPPVEDVVAPKNDPPTLPNPGEMKTMELQHSEIMQLYDRMRVAAGADQSLFKRLVKPLMANPAVRNNLPISVRQVAQAEQIGKSIQGTMAEANLRALQKNYPDQLALGSPLDLFINRVIDGKDKLENVEKFTAAETNRKPLENMLRRNYELNKLIAAEQGIPEGVSRFDVDGYGARQYLSKKLSANGKWAEIARRAGLVDKAVDYLAKANPGKHPAEIAQMMDQVLRSPDTFGAFKASPLGSVWNHIKKLQDLPQPLREAMGEIESGAYRLATSLGIQESIYAQLKNYKEIALNPSMSAGDIVTASQMGFHPDAIPDVPEFGALRGRYVHPDVREALMDSNQIVHQANHYVAQASRFHKAMMLLGNFKALVHHMTGNLLASFEAGGAIPLPQGLGGPGVAKGLKTWSTAMRAELAFARDPNAAGLSELAKEARLLGAWSPGVGSAEIQSAAQRVDNAYMAQLQKLIGEKHLDSFDLYQKLYQRAGAGIQKTYGETIRQYDHILQTVKLANYVGLREKFLNRMGQIDTAMKGGALETELAQQHGRYFEAYKANNGNIVEAARRMAALDVNASFSNPMNVPPGIRNVANSAMGGLIPILTPLAEATRVTMQLPGRMARDPALAVRLASLGAGVGAWYGIHRMNRVSNGVTDAMVDAAIKTHQQNWRTAPDWAYYAQTDLDEKGRVQLHDFAHVWPLVDLARGRRMDPMSAKLLQNSLVNLLMVQGTPAEPTVRNTMSGLGFGSPMPVPDPREGELQQNWTNLLMNMGFVPGAFGEIYNAGKSTGAYNDGRPISPFKELHTPMQAIQGMMGFPTQPVSIGQQSPSADARDHAAKHEMDDLRRQMWSASPEAQKRIEARMNRIDADAKEAADARHAAAPDLQKARERK